MTLRFCTHESGFCRLVYVLSDKNCIRYKSTASRFGRKHASHTVPVCAPRSPSRLGSAIESERIYTDPRPQMYYALCPIMPEILPTKLLL